MFHDRLWSCQHDIVQKIVSWNRDLKWQKTKWEWWSSLTTGQLAHSFGPGPSFDTILVFADTTEAQEHDHYPIAQGVPGPMGHRACQALHAAATCLLSSPSQLQAGWHSRDSGLSSRNKHVQLSATCTQVTYQKLPGTDWAGLGWSFSPATRESKAQGSSDRAFEHRPWIQKWV